MAGAISVCVVAVALDAAVDMHIHRVQKAVGLALVAHLHAGCLIGVIEQLDLAADESHRRLVEYAV